MKKRTRVQTLLYGEQHLERTEIDLLHTPALQRLYDLHQLGFTDRVYPDASHARFHHILGVLTHVDKLMTAIERNLKGNEALDEVPIGPWNSYRSVKREDLISEIPRLRPVARLMGLLHDLTHAPFGHTLEDEIEVSESRHDYPVRQADMFYRLLCQYFAWLVRDNECPECSRPLRRSSRPCEKCGWNNIGRSRVDGNRSLSDTSSLLEYMDAPELLAPPSDVMTVAEIAASFLRSPLRAHRIAHYAGPLELVTFLKNLNLAMEALLHLELLHNEQGRLQSKHVPASLPYPFQRLIRQILKLVGDPLSSEHCFRPHRDAFLLDVIGNTVCADLMDYAKRDSLFAGLKQDFDADRIAETFTLVSTDFTERTIRDEPTFTDPFAGKVLRTAISLRTHKLRTDVPGQVMGLLQARFHINERALFHPTKCIAGAMLGSALQFLRFETFPDPPPFYVPAAVRVGCPRLGRASGV